MGDASNEWMAQFNCGGGSPVLDCVCGKTHVAIDSDDVDEKNRDSYEFKAREDANYVLHYGVDSVTEHTFGGMTIVDDCDCGRMARIEQLISRERDFILGYFRALAEKAERESAAIRAGLSNAALTPTQERDDG